MTHPAVSLCAVVGVPDERLGEEVKAYVVRARCARDRTGRDRLVPRSVRGVQGATPRRVQGAVADDRDRQGAEARAEVRPRALRRGAPGAAGRRLVGRALRYTALLVFAGLVFLGLFVPRLAGRVFWTVAIASLPAFFVLAGYHRWRRICPLAFVAQLPVRLGVAGGRRAGPWLQAHAYHVSFAVFVLSLWLRLVATNGDGHAIAVFVLTLCAAAFGAGLVLTGKSWCNYLCPVLFVEKLYTEPRGLRDTANSQCETCTACRPACPDINEEHSYWKEISCPPSGTCTSPFPAWCWRSTATTSCRPAPGATTSEAPGRTTRAFFGLRSCPVWTRARPGSSSGRACRAPRRPRSHCSRVAR